MCITMMCQLNFHMTVSNFHIVPVVFAILVIEVQTVILVMSVLTFVAKDSEGHGLIWLIRNVANFIAPWQNRILLNKQWQFINWSVNQDRILAAIFNAIPEINPFTFWQVDCTASLTFLNNWSCQNVFAHHVFIIHVIHMWIIFII